MKTTILRKALAAILLLCAAGPLHGQEFIREVIQDFLLADTSIVRTIGNDSVLISNKNYTSTLMVVTSGMSIGVPTRYINPIYVNDFEIAGKRVYFCGYKVDREVKKAVFGYFNLSLFTNTDSILYYYVLDSCAELKKIDYFRFGDDLYYEYHIVMTGTTGTRSDVLVHKIMLATIPEPPFPPNPLDYCDVYFSNNENENFDDVAVTDNYVVVSTRNKVNGTPFIDFWQFEKPTLSLMPLLYSNINHLRLLTLHPETPVFLEHISDDDYAAVYKKNNDNKMSMLLLNAPNTVVKAVDIAEDESHTIIPIDIKYNKKSSVFDILARSRYRDNEERLFALMQIYHVTQDIINNIAPYGLGTWYSGFRLLWSIDPTRWSNYFVASGAESQMPRLFKYKHDEWKQCPKKFYYDYSILFPNEVIFKDKLPQYKLYKLDRIEFVTRIREIPFPVTCPQSNN